MRYSLQGLQAQMWTSLPAIVQSVDLTAMTLECTPAINGVATNSSGAQSYVQMPLLVDVPIVYPNGGGLALTFPIEEGDEVLVVMSCRCIDSWWQNGGIQNPMELRMHDLSDGFAIPGPKSQPNVLSAISATAAQLRDDEGTSVFGLDADSKLFKFENPDQSLSGLLNTMLSIQNDLVTALTTFATGLNPGNLAAQSAALVTSLGTITTEISEAISDIGELLE